MLPSESLLSVMSKRINPSHQGKLSTLILSLWSDLLSSSLLRYDWCIWVRFEENI